jgi:hypothetical protein
MIGIRASRSRSIGLWASVRRRGRTRAELHRRTRISQLVLAFVSGQTTYGAAWQQPTAILPGRLFKFVVQMDF